MFASISKDKLAEIMVAEGMVAKDKMKELSKLSRRELKTVFDLLMEKQILKQEEVVDFLSEQLEIPILNVNAYRIPGDVLKMIPKRIVTRYRVVPLSRINKLLTLATSNPFELMIQDDIKGLTNCDIALVLLTPTTIDGLIEQYYSETGNLDDILEGIDEDSLEVIDAKAGEEGEGSDEAGSESAPVVRMVNLILDEGIRFRASDIHFEPYEREFRVRYRIDGALKEHFKHSRDLYNSIVARIKIMSTLDITEKRVPQDGRFRIKQRGKEIDFRVSILPNYFGEKIVMRILDRGGIRAGLDKLGLSEKPTQILADAIKQPYGMILITGPTGSGKSTTLYTILNTMNTPDRNIMTIEDPVEYQIEGITQTQAHAEVGLTFASGLRCLLRQSPDIVLVGEIRDGETADIAVKASLTGHLVFSTLHTNSAAGAVTRLMDMGVEPFLIASSAVAVGAQRLVKRVCQYCKAKCSIPEDVIRRSGLDKSVMKGVQAFKGKGCAKCNQTGYFGRMATIEIMQVDSDIRDLIIQRKSSYVIHELAVKKGMETLFDNAFSIFKKGLTTMEEVLRVASKE